MAEADKPVSSSSAAPSGNGDDNDGFDLGYDVEMSEIESIDESIIVIGDDSDIEVQLDWEPSGLQFEVVDEGDSEELNNSIIVIDDSDEERNDGEILFEANGVELAVEEDNGDELNDSIITIYESDEYDDLDDGDDLGSRNNPILLSFLQ